MEVTRKPRNLASNGDSAWDRGLRNGRKEQARFHRRKEAARFLSTISMKAEPNQAGVTPSANTSLHRVRLNINRSNEDLQVSHDDQRHGNGTGHGVAMADINSIDSRPMMQQDTDDIREGQLLEPGVLPNGGTTYIASRGGLRGIRKPLVLVSPHSRCPFYMFTVIKYDPGEKDLQGEADAQSGHFGVQQRTRERGTLSYMQLLESSWPQTDEAKEGLKKRTYIMDDPALRSGKHRQVLALPSIKMSVIQYAKPSDLKRDLNEQFRERHPDLQISLSKMRSLKMALTEIVLDAINGELAIVALSHLYFEHLIEKGAVNKANRKVLAGCSLLLAFKFYSARSDADTKRLIEAIDEEFGVSKRELLSAEFSAYVQLDFALHLAWSEVMPYFQTLVQICDYSEQLFDPYVDNGNPYYNARGAGAAT